MAKLHIFNQFAPSIDVTNIFIVMDMVAYKLDIINTYLHISYN